VNENYPDYTSRREYREERRRARKERLNSYFPMEEVQPVFDRHQTGFSNNTELNQNYPAPGPAPVYYQPQERSRQSRLVRRRNLLIVNAVSFMLFSALLVLVWFSSQSGYFWPLWVIGPWVIGLLNQALYVWLGQRNH